VISWITVATRPDDETALQAHLQATLEPLPAGDELVVVGTAASITLAYGQGQRRATQPIRCYVHADVQIRDVPRLRSELIEATDGTGIVGVIGSREPGMPWWNRSCLGSVIDTRMGLIDFGLGGECAMLDGLLLATRQTVDWDVDAPGWHGYDADACSQMLARGLTNWCLSDGASMVEHHAAPTKDRTTGYSDAAARWRERWTA
jgi:hypothetical protein